VDDRLKIVATLLDEPYLVETVARVLSLSDEGRSPEAKKRKTRTAGFVHGDA
jgi:hypothetical protein